MASSHPDGVHWDVLLPMLRPARTALQRLLSPGRLVRIDRRNFWIKGHSEVELPTTRLGRSRFLGDHPLISHKRRFWKLPSSLGLVMNLPSRVRFFIGS
jgi:hypothetical protein